jgi:hypothetical protein
MHFCILEASVNQEDRKNNTMVFIFPFKMQGMVVMVSAPMKYVVFLRPSSLEH